MKKKTLLYEYSLWRLFWQSGLTGMIIWAFAEVAIVFVCIYKGFHMKEHSILLLFMWVFGLVVFYTRPIISLFQVFQQQAAIGIRWRDRTDFDKEEHLRDWYVIFDGGGFLLYHRNYIKKILRTVKEEQTDGDGHSRGHWYALCYEDVTGKQRKIKFSSTAWEKEFRKWYKQK